MSSFITRRAHQSRSQVGRFNTHQQPARRGRINNRSVERSGRVSITWSPWLREVRTALRFQRHRFPAASTCPRLRVRLRWLRILMRFRVGVRSELIQTSLISWATAQLQTAMKAQRILRPRVTQPRSFGRPTALRTRIRTGMTLSPARPIRVRRPQLLN